MFDLVLELSKRLRMISTWTKTKINQRKKVRLPSAMLLCERKVAKKSFEFVYSTKNINRPTDIEKLKFTSSAVL